MFTMLKEMNIFSVGNLSVGYVLLYLLHRLIFYKFDNSLEVIDLQDISFVKTDDYTESYIFLCNSLGEWWPSD